MLHCTGQARMVGSTGRGLGDGPPNLGQVPHDPVPQVNIFTDAKELNHTRSRWSTPLSASSSSPPSSCTRLTSFSVWWQDTGRVWLHQSDGTAAGHTHWGAGLLGSRTHSPVHQMKRLRPCASSLSQACLGLLLWWSCRTQEAAPINKWCSERALGPPSYPSPLVPQPLL